MIDKAEFRIPHTPKSGIPYTDDFRKILADQAGGPFLKYSRSRFYTSTLDARPLGYPALLHINARHAKQPVSKIELLETGSMKISEIESCVQNIFEVDVRKLELMRLDAAVDLADIPVNWFDKHVRIKRKQYLDQYEELRRRLGKSGLQTTAFGKRPNMIRIYDKTAERRKQYGELRRLHGSGCGDFEEIFGTSPDAVVTRLERQMGGGRIPDEFATLEAIAANFATFDPFECVEFLKAGTAEPCRANYDFDTYCGGMYLRERVERDGLNATLKWMNAQTGGQLKRTLNRFGNFVLQSSLIDFDKDELLVKFRETLRKQLEN